MGAEIVLDNGGCVLPSSSSEAGVRAFVAALVAVSVREREATPQPPFHASGSMSPAAYAPPRL